MAGYTARELYEASVLADAKDVREAGFTAAEAEEDRIK